MRRPTQSVLSLRFSLFASHVILMGEKSGCVSNIKSTDPEREGKKGEGAGVLVNIFCSGVSWRVHIGFVGV